jgi:hypothetical protein
MVLSGRIPLGGSLSASNGSLAERPPLREVRHANLAWSFAVDEGTLIRVRRAKGSVRQVVAAGSTAA